MGRRMFAVMAVVALFGAACGDDDEDTGATATTTAAAGSEGGSVTIEVDGKPDDLSMSALAYFPSDVKVHPGDTLTFHSNDTGEPHTVTFGTIADEGLKAFFDLPESVRNSDQPPDPSQIPPAVAALDEKLPPLLPEGPGDANQMAANPCFVTTGDPPTDAACPKVSQPNFDGKQSVYNSGFLPDDATFDVQLANDIAPGTYNYFCLLHRQGMVGSITVVPEDEEVPSADEVKKAGEDELETKFVSKLRAQAQKVANTAADAPVAGAPPEEGEEPTEGSLNAFGPEELEVKAGSAVTWTVFGPHTIALNAPEDARGVMVKAPDGTWHANEKAFTPAGGAGAPPPPDGPPGPPDPNAKPVLVDGGTYDGSTYHSSGLILSFGPPGYQYKLTFAKAGTYEVICQIHPDMEQIVKVT